MAHEARVFGVRHFDDVESGLPKQTRIEEPPIPVLVKRQLEGGLLVAIGVTDRGHVFGKCLSCRKRHLSPPRLIFVREMRLEARRWRCKALRIMTAVRV